MYLVRSSAPNLRKCPGKRAHGYSRNLLITPYWRHFGSGVKVTPEFDPLEVTINLGVIYVGIPYLVL